MTVVLPFFVIGCGSEPAEFDKTAHYTPEALAQELALRYRALNPSAQTSKLGPRKNKLASGSTAAGKPSRKSATKTTKKSGPPSIDDVLDDIEYKITLVKETSPAETTKKMIEAIAGRPHARGQREESPDRARAAPHELTPTALDPMAPLAIISAAGGWYRRASL